MNLTTTRARKGQQHRVTRIAMTRVLVTAFPPFSNFEVNVSQQILTMFERVEFDDIDVETMLLSVDKAGSSIVSQMIERGSKWDAIVHLGLAGKREKISLERFGKNHSEFNEKDNSGRIANGMIIEGVTESIETTTSIHLLDEEFEHDDDVLWSIDAGSYVCNETYFRTLHSVSSVGENTENNQTVPVIFIHLPSTNHISLERQFDIVCRAVRTIAVRPTLEVVGALLYDSEGRMLACRRPPDDAWGGWWEFPGGKIDSGELEIEALKREILEELSIAVFPKNRVTSLSYDYSDRRVNLYIWDCGCVDSGKILPTEHDEVRWLNSNELDQVKWLPADEPLIAEWKQNGFP